MTANQPIPTIGAPVKMPDQLLQAGQQQVTLVLKKTCVFTKKPQPQAILNQVTELVGALRQVSSSANEIMVELPENAAAQLEGLAEKRDARLRNIGVQAIKKGDTEYSLQNKTICDRLLPQKITINLGFISIDYELTDSNRCLACVLLPLLLVGAAAFLFVTYPPVSPCGYPADITTDQLQIEWIIQQEGAAVVAEDIQIIQTIFDPKAVIIDTLKPTKWNDPVERYTNLFTAAQYTQADHPAIQRKAPITERAVFTSASSGQYTDLKDNRPHTYENPPESDEWTLEKKNGCWKITKFHFNIGLKAGN